MKTVIIDDEKQAIVAMKLLLKALKPEIEIIGQAEGVLDGAKLIDEKKPELVLLDINLGNGDGFELLRKVQFKNFHLIFVTAYNQHALRAFEYNAIDYLLKPTDHDALIRGIEKAEKLIKATNISEAQLRDIENQMEGASPQFLVVNTEREYVKLPLQEVVCLKADGNYTHIKLKDGKNYLVSKKLKHYEQLLKSDFVRIHRSFIINKNAIRSLISSPAFMVRLNNGDAYPISIRRKKEVMLALR